MPNSKRRSHFLPLQDRQRNRLPFTCSENLQRPNLAISFNIITNISSNLYFDLQLVHIYMVSLRKDSQQLSLSIEIYKCIQKVMNRVLLLWTSVKTLKIRYSFLFKIVAYSGKNKSVFQRTQRYKYLEYKTWMTIHRNIVHAYLKTKFHAIIIFRRYKEGPSLSFLHISQLFLFKTYKTPCT